MSATSLIFFSLLTLLTTVPSTANSDILNVVRYVESIKNFHATTTTTAYQILDEENSNRSDTSYLPSTSLVFSSRLSLLSTVSLTSNSPVSNVVRYVESIKTFMSNTITTAHHVLVEENSNHSDTSLCQRPTWYSPPCCPCRPQCR